MMDKDEKGSDSRKNESIDEEKPLKKARYLWEVKGKGHLKNSLTEANCSTIDGEASPQEACTTDEAGSSKIPVTVCGNRSPPSKCCIETFLAKTEDIMDRDSSDEDDSEKLPLEHSIESETPVTLVSALPNNQDYYLRKWQARQIARGFVDNTINSMLETWVDRPFDAANFFDFDNNIQNDDQVEDDAILMAIQSHGLQSGWRGSSSNSVANSNFNSNSNSSFGSNFAVAGSSSESQSEIGSSVIQDSTNDNLENLQKEQENESSVASSSSSMSVDTNSSISNPYEIDLGDPMDFLNAAVSVAIQKKGLTYG